MRSAKGFWLAAAAISCVITGLFLGSGGMVALSLPLMLYLAMTSLFLTREDVEIRIERKLSDTRFMAGDSVDIEIVVQNTGPRIELLELVDPLPEYAVLKEGNNRALMAMDEGEEQSFRYTLACPLRGRYRLENLRIRYMDINRLHQVEEEVPLHSEFSVVARAEPSRGLKIAPRKTRNWVGMIKSRKVGIGTEFFGMRDYVQGDELRKINWKASARLDGLLTNEYEAECSGDLTLVLDARLEANLGKIHDSTVEHGVRAASTIAAQVLRDKNRVGLIVLRDIIDEVYPAFGKRQFYKLSEHLLDVRPVGLLPFDSIGWMVMSYFPLESQIILISALTDSEIVKTIGDLCARGFDVVVVSPSPLIVEGELVSESREKALALRILMLERENLISELRRFARIADWDTNEPLAKALKGVELSGPRR